MQCLVTGEEHDKFCDVHIFYAPLTTSKIANTCDGIDLSSLRTFAIQFKNDAAELIKLADTHRILEEYISQNGSRHFTLEQNRDDSYYQSLQLTKREIEVANILVTGKTAIEISEDLHISRRTVEHHIENIKDKTHCRKRSELIHFFHENGGIK